MENVVYLETMGCQMNKLDSELIMAQFTRRGYRLTEDIDSADVVLFNTCSVRQHAEDKVISKIGQLRRRHQEQPGFTLAIVGCMAQRLGQSLLEKYQQVDVVCGPGQIHQLSDMIETSRLSKQKKISLNDPTARNELEQLDLSRQQSDTQTPFKAYVRAMRGCNNFCHYCIVPYVRGPEQSRPLEHIAQEARRLAEQGVKEITLLGQTVNSYHFKQNGKTCGLADVLEKMNDIEGLQRIRFVTNYPRNFDERIFQAMAALPKVCEYLHIPAQSGSDRILQAMNRRYTARQYLELIARAREMVPNLAVAGDFIVGYCGETEKDFEATCELLRKVHYKNCFIFKYSPRPGTRADQKLTDNVPDKLKRQRNTTLLNLQHEIALRDNQQFVGQTAEILVEGAAKKPHLNQRQKQSPTLRARENPPEQPTYMQLVGRTRGDYIVVFKGNPELVGQLLSVRVIKASALTLFAELPR